MDNENLEESRFTCNFPNLLISGYWNRTPDHLMHIFEYQMRENCVTYKG